MSSNSGRPTKQIPSTVTKLIASLREGASDAEACAEAGISRNTFYRWIEENQEFSDKITLARSAPNKKAKEVILTAIKKGDVKAAQWWLERKAKGEFSDTHLSTEGSTRPIAIIDMSPIDNEKPLQPFE